MAKRTTDLAVISAPLVEGGNILDELGGVLTDSDRAYLQKADDSISVLTAAEDALQARIAEMKKRMKETPLAKQLAEAQGKLKQVKEMRRERSTMVRGVIEARLVESGKGTFGEEVLALPALSGRKRS